MKLDPEERIIAAALDQAELDDTKECGAFARIEFKQEGHAKVTITISREPHCKQTSRSVQASAVVSAPYRWVFSPGSGST